MVNQSKINDPRFWKKWRESGATSIITPVIHKNENSSVSYSVEKISVPYSPSSIDGVVEIFPGDFYVKSEKALSDLRGHLEAVGYDFEDTSSRSYGHEKPSRVIQEKEGWALWFGKLSDQVFQTRGECGSCKSLIDTLGIRSHGHKCEKCGEATYLEYVQGGEISFRVAGSRDFSFNSPTFVIHSYDSVKNKLNLYVNPADCSQRRKRRMRNFDLTPEQSMDLVPEFLEKYPQTFKLKNKGRVKVLSINHKADGMVHKDGINTSSIEGDIQNFRLVKLFGDKILGEWDHIPIPETVHIYEAWHWAPLGPSPDLYERIISAARQVSRKDYYYYYQYGRPAFCEGAIDNMLKFVKNFTTLDADYVGKHINSQMSGPGLIDALANVTGHEEYIETAPNIGNALILISKLSRGFRGGKVDISQGEVDAGLIAITHDMKHEGLIGKILNPQTK